MAIESSYLRTYVCFQDLSDAQLDSVAQNYATECFYPGHTLFEDSAPGNQLYLLTQGEVEGLFTIGEGGLVLVDQLGIGCVIGCDVRTPPHRYCSTACSVRKREALVVDTQQLIASMQEDCQLGLSIQQYHSGIAGSD